MRLFIAGHRGMVGRAILARVRDMEGVTPFIAARADLDLRDAGAVAAFLRGTRPDRIILAAAKVGGIAANMADPAGMLTDLATSRWFTKPVLGRVGPHLEAAIIHDYLSIAWQDVTARRDRRRPRRGDFEFSNAAMMAMLARGTCTRW